MTEYDDNADNVLGPVLQPPAAPAPYMTEDMMMGGPSMADELASIEQDLNMTRRFVHNEDKTRTFFFNYHLYPPRPLILFTSYFCEFCTEYATVNWISDIHSRLNRFIWRIE